MTSSMPRERKRKWLFNLAAAGSGVMMLLVMSVWLRSYFAMDEVNYQPRGDDVLHSYVVGWGHGYVGFLARAAGQPASFHVFWQSWRPYPPQAAWGVGGDEVIDLLGMRVYTGEELVIADTTVRVVAIYLPCWHAALLSAAFPAVWLISRLGRRRVARQRREAGCCVRCGYDIRATPDACPECGATAAAAARVGFSAAPVPPPTRR